MKTDIILQRCGIKNSFVYIALAFIIFGAASCSTAGQIDDNAAYENYTPPDWAPPYDDISMTHYYYFPDYDIYYDVWSREFWYLNGGAWAFSAGLPPMFGNINLYNSYIVLVNRKEVRPWEHNTYYVQNYPQHCYQNYKNIVVNNRVIRNVAPNHELIPRAYNENNNRVTFMQHPANKPVENKPASYHNVVHEVPMHYITPSMPKESRSLNYGGGFRRRR